MKVIHTANKSKIKISSVSCTPLTKKLFKECTPATASKEPVLEYTFPIPHVPKKIIPKKIKLLGLISKLRCQANQSIAIIKVE